MNLTGSGPARSDPSRVESRQGEALPDFTDDATDRLRHTLAAFDDAGDAEWAIRATIVDGETTGLTWGDLRELLRRLDD